MDPGLEHSGPFQARLASLDVLLERQVSSANAGVPQAVELHGSACLYAASFVKVQLVLICLLPRAGNAGVEAPLQLFYLVNSGLAQGSSCESEEDVRLHSEVYDAKS